MSLREQSNTELDQYALQNPLISDHRIAVMSLRVQPNTELEKYAS